MKEVEAKAPAALARREEAAAASAGNRKKTVMPCWRRAEPAPPVLAIEAHCRPTNFRSRSRGSTGRRAGDVTVAGRALSKICKPVRSVSDTHRRPSSFHDHQSAGSPSTFRAADFNGLGILSRRKKRIAVVGPPGSAEPTDEAISASEWTGMIGEAQQNV